MERKKLWVALAESLGPRSPLLRPLLDRFGTPEEIFAADEAALREAVPDIGQGTVAALLKKTCASDADRIVSWCYRSGVRILTYDGEDYPASLRNIDEPPAVLYCRGNLPSQEGRLAVAVVGTRRPDAYGEQVTYKLSFEMAAAGAVIVSGMADGLDAIAAAGALNAGGETVAVLGCGIDVVYPRHHTRLAAEIAQSGAIVTEFAPGTPPNGWNFPIRNRLISGLSGGVLVVEAGERSGAMITARYAVVQGKPLFAVPGDVTAPRSVGTNSLLANGALPALSTDGLLSHFRFLYRDGIRLQKVVEAEQYSLLTPQELRRFGLRIHAQEAPVPTQEEKPRKKLKLKRKKAQAVTDGAAPVTGSAPPDTSLLTPRQKELYAMLPAEPFTVDALTAQGVPVAEAVSCLTVFEIYGLLASRPGGTFEKK